MVGLGAGRYTSLHRGGQIEEAMVDRRSPFMYLVQRYEEYWPYFSGMMAWFERYITSR